MIKDIEIDIGLTNLVENSDKKSYKPLSQINRYETEITYSDFFKNNLINNEPCIFGSWLTKDWLSSKEWVDEEGTPDCQYLSKYFGLAKVPVADCNNKHFDSQKKETFMFNEYLDYFLKKKTGKEQRCLYLKDWHFTKTFPLYKSYIVPLYFSSDWLNEFWTYKDDPDDDYKFVYIGPQGSWTPFHADVFWSFSWSANICGQKRWIFYPPSESDFLKDNFGNVIYDIESPDLKDLSQFPQAERARGKIEIIQEEGETIFVPSKWHHQVYNLVENAIEDCREMDGWLEQCQLILKSTHGMDVQDFFLFLKTIAERRIKYLKGDQTISSFPEWRFGINQVKYDVKKLILCFNRLHNSLSSDIVEYIDKFEAVSQIIDELECFA